MARVSGRLVRGRRRFGSIDSVKALGNTWMTVEADSM